MCLRKEARRTARSGFRESPQRLAARRCHGRGRVEGVIQAVEGVIQGLEVSFWWNCIISANVSPLIPLPGPSPRSDGEKGDGAEAVPQLPSPRVREEGGGSRMRGERFGDYRGPDEGQTRLPLPPAG